MYKIRWSIVLLLVFVQACASLQGMGRNSGGEQRWTAMSKSEVLEFLKAQERNWHAFSAQAYLEVHKKDVQVGGDVMILSGGPGEFYVEFTGPLGAQAIVSSDGKLLYVWDVRAKAMAISPADKGIALLVRLPLSAEDFTRLLRGILPVGKKVAGFRFADGRYQIISHTNTAIWMANFAADGRISKCVIETPNKKTVAAMSYLGSSSGKFLPFTFARLELPNSIEIDISVRKGSYREDIEYDPAVFVLNPPPFVKKFWGYIELNLPRRGQ